MRIKKRYFFDNILIFVLYLGSLEMLLRGVARTVHPKLEVLIVVLLQGIFFGFPILFFLYGSISKRFLVVIALFVYLGLPE
jgi:hypothetical protein